MNSILIMTTRIPQYNPSLSLPRLIYYTFVGLIMGGICFGVGMSGLTTRENAGYIFFSIIFLFIGAMVASARRSKFAKFVLY